MSPQLTGLRTLARGNRYKDILASVVRNGFGDVLAQLNIPLPGPKPQEDLKDRKKRFRRMLEDLGPTFIKIGQVLSVRPDLISEGLMAELSKLQDSITPLPMEEVEATLERDFGEQWRETLGEVDPDPLGSGSLAQVHRATLPDGREAALKILKPDIRGLIRTDLEILSGLSESLDGRIAEVQNYDLPGIVEELSAMLLRELEVDRERRNMRLARRNLAGQERIFVPEVFEDISSENVLVMEYVDGTPLAEATDINDEERTRLARAGLRASMKQVLEDGFFHADPHPGNLLLRQDGMVAFLDWGMVGRITPRMRDDLVDLVLALVDRDSETGLRVLADITGARIGPAANLLERDLLEVMDLAAGDSSQRAPLGRVLMEVTTLLRRHSIRVPPDLAVMIKALITAEGASRLLCPELDAVSEARPIVRRIGLRRRGLSGLLRSLKGTAGAIARLNRVLPGRLGRISAALERGNLSIRFHHEGLGGMRDTLERASNRLSLAVVLGAIFLGSSMIMTTGMEPLVFGFPVLGVLGYVVSGALGLWLALSILRRRRF